MSSAKTYLLFDGDVGRISSSKAPGIGIQIESAVADLRVPGWAETVGWVRRHGPGLWACVDAEEFVDTSTPPSLGGEAEGQVFRLVV